MIFGSRVNARATVSSVDKLLRLFGVFPYVARIDNNEVYLIGQSVRRGGAVRLS